MISGIYYSNTGLNTIQLRIDVNANNIANVNTVAFKQERTSVSTFKEKLVAVNRLNLLHTSQGAACRDIRTDFSSGMLLNTGRQLDFALTQEGVFFTLQTGEGLKYTRNGSFRVNNQGELVDINGYPVLGYSGTITVNDGTPEQGFYLVAFDDLEQLSRQGGYFIPRPGAAERPVENVEVKQGYLETANVDLVNSLSELLVNSRQYALNSRVIATYDAILRKAANEVGSLK
ncbi:MAG: flagellar hook-basal body complex protein [Syntrophomonadaceae bacterium]|nr:flagellar hook-basal body complex protein [Syntrophomonadaceae bacterium]